MKALCLLLIISLGALLSGCGTLHGSAQKSSGSPAHFGLSADIPLGGR